MVIAAALAGCAMDTGTDGLPDGTPSYALGAADCPMGTTVVMGTTGVDVLTSDPDIVECFVANDGADIITAGPGDVVFAGKGDDDIRYDGGSIKVYGEDGNDSMTVFGPGNGLVTFYGGEGDDFSDMSGAGFSGRLVARGEAGNDTLNGGPNRDKIEGGTGNDYINGLGDVDTLYGQAGDDTMLGGTGRDTMFGGSGNDDMRGEGANDILRGEAGEDILKGGNGADVIDGGDGNDLLFDLGDGFVDSFMAGAGHDVILASGGDFGSGDADLDNCPMGFASCEMLPAPTACDSDAQCGGGTTCATGSEGAAGVCVYCRSDADCDAGLVCLPTLGCII